MSTAELDSAAVSLSKKHIRFLENQTALQKAKPRLHPEPCDTADLHSTHGHTLHKHANIGLRSLSAVPMLPLISCLFYCLCVICHGELHMSRDGFVMPVPSGHVLATSHTAKLKKPECPIKYILYLLYVCVCTCVCLHACMCDVHATVHMWRSENNWRTLFFTI